MTKGFKKVCTNLNRCILAAGLLLVVLSSCTKANYLDVDAADRSPLSAKISFVNARPENQGLLFWTYTTKVTTTPVAINNATPYLDAQFGLVQINVSAEGGSSYLSSRVFGGSATFTSNGGPNGPIPGYYHTVFAAKAKANSFKADSLMLFYDDLAAPPAGKAKLRFVNLSPGVDSVDVIFGGSPLFSKVKYGEAGGAILSGAGLNLFSIGPYTTVDAKSGIIEILNSGSGTPVLFKGGGIGNIILQEGKIYTAFISGESSNGILLSVLQHN